jgi:hypothetical protein
MNVRFASVKTGTISALSMVKYTKTGVNLSIPTTGFGILIEQPTRYAYSPRQKQK